MDLEKLCWKRIYIVLRYLLSIKPSDIYKELNILFGEKSYSRSSMDQLTHQLRHNNDKRERLLEFTMTDRSFENLQFDLNTSTEDKKTKIVQFYALSRAQLKKNLNEIIDELNLLFSESIYNNVDSLTQWIIRYWKNNNYPVCISENLNFLSGLLESNASFEQENHNLKSILNEKNKEIYELKLDNKNLKSRIKTVDDVQNEFEDNMNTSRILISFLTDANQRIQKYFEENENTRGLTSLKTILNDTLTLNSKLLCEIQRFHEREHNELKRKRNSDDSENSNIKRISNCVSKEI